MTKLMDVVNDRIKPGDHVDVNGLAKEFKEHGFKANYRVIESGSEFCWTVLVVRDGPNAVEVPIETDKIESVIMAVDELEYGEESRFED